MIVASDGTKADFFGKALDVDGDWMAVGAPGEEIPGENTSTNRGAVYVYRRVRGEWIEHQKLIPFDWDDDSKFGSAIDLSGDVLAIGAPGPPSRAYVFRLHDGEWVEEARLVSIDPVMITLGDGLGSSVAIQGNVAAFGAPYDSEHGDFSGAAHVFEFINGVWLPQMKIVPRDLDEGARLGTAIAISDNSEMIAVGAPHQDLEPSVNGGAVYFYRPSPNADAPWAQRAKVRPQDGVTRRFGNAVAIDSARMVVGAHGDALLGSYTGAAFIFEFDGADWAQVQRLYAADAADDDEFGSSVALENDTIVVGAWNEGGSFFEPGPAPFHGAVYTFHLRDGEWTQTHKFVGAEAYHQPYANLGADVAIQDQIAYSGAWRGNIQLPKGGAVVSNGEVYLFDTTIPLVSDLNLDGDVNGADIAFLLAVWGKCEGLSDTNVCLHPCNADLTQDGVVNGADLAILLANWTI